MRTHSLKVNSGDRFLDAGTIGAAVGGGAFNTAFLGQIPHRVAVAGSETHGIDTRTISGAIRNDLILDAGGGPANYGGPDHPPVNGAAGAISALGDHYWQGVVPGREVADAAETTATTYAMTVGQSFYGRISDVLDEDWVAITLTAGATYDIRLLGMGNGLLSDPLVRIYNSAGTELLFNDDGFTSNSSTHEADSRLIFTAPTTGVYYISADAYETATGDYLLSATAHNPAGMVFTADEIAWQLLNNGWAFFGRPQAARFTVGADSSLTVNLTALTAEGQFLAREALKVWSSFTSINFVETAGAAEITFDDNQNGAFANPLMSGSVITSSTINIGLDWLTRFGTTLNSYSFETYIHEVGHAIGLAHGGNYNGSADYGTDNFYLNDGLAWSIMSYMQAYNDEFTGPNTFLDASFRYMVTPMIADIIAIQYLYGVSSEFTGDTVWGFNGNTGVTAIDTAVNNGALMAMTVYDTGGVDTLDFSQTTEAQIISLAAESMSSVLGGRHNLSIARGVTIENATGGSGVDVITGNAAANTLSGGAGADTLIGGAGDDTYIVDDLGDVVTELGNQGADTVRSSVNFSLTDNIETLILTGGANINGTGNKFANTITGNSGANVINGGLGADTMAGGAGSDTYYVQHENDKVIEANVAGTDLILASISFTLAADQFVENLTLTGSANINGTGNKFANTITGNAGANVINGGLGADIMAGGAGSDTYYVQHEGDVVIEANGAGTDLIYASISFTLAADQFVETLTLTGSTDINGTGNKWANTITGNSGANVINGGLGSDTMAGGAGSDTYYVQQAGDVVIETQAAGTDIVSSTVSFSLAGQHIENLTLTGSAAIDGAGNDLDNSLLGNTGANNLNGGGGADRIRGGGGADVLTGGGAADTFVFAAVADSTVALFDRITDLTSADRIDLSAIDASTTAAGNQAFTLVDAFTEVAGQMTLDYAIGANQTTILMDLNGDGLADMKIVADGNHEAFSGFIL